MPEPLRSTLAVLLHADVVGSTRLVQSGQVAAHTSMRQAFDQLGAAVRRRNGVVHEIRGDALVAEFPRPSDAVLAALAFQDQRRSSAAGHSSDQPLLRIGIAMGEVVIADGTITGAGVVLAQRLEQLAPAGGVCVSEAVREATPAHLPIRVESLGSKQLKGFDTPVSAHLLCTEADAVLPAPESDPGRPPRRRWAVPTLAAIALAGVIAAGLVPLQSHREPLHGDPPMPTAKAPVPDAMAPSVLAPNVLAPNVLAPNVLATNALATIAVLPFADRQPGREDAYLGAGIAEDIATDLTGVDALRVVYHQPRRAGSDHQQTPVEVAAARSVRYVVSGSIRRTPERLRISAQLYDARSDDVVWAERLDGQVDDIFAFQDRITGAVVSAVSDALGASIGTPGNRRYTPDSQAYDLYVQGRARRIPPTAKNLAIAAGLFERAIAIDPGFAGGHAGAAWTNILRYSECFDDCAPLVVTAEAQARAAIRIDDTFGPAFGSLAEVLFRRGDFTNAIAAARRAVEVSPNDALMLATLGRVVGHGGDPERGIAITRAAHRMSPDSLPMLFYLGSLYRLSGRFDQAIDALTRHREQLGGRILPAPTAQLVAALAEAGRIEEARALLGQLLHDLPRLGVAEVLKTFSFASSDSEAAFVKALVAAGLPDNRGAG